MQANKIVYNPFIRTSDTTSRVMVDVIIALLPTLFMTWWAFGMAALSLVAVSVGSALVAEYVFSIVFLRKFDTLNDGSAIVTGLLLAFTLGAFTPCHVVAFGSAMAVVFGKLVWGGVGRNLFNPALVGREFMAVFFPAVMTSGTIWYEASAVNHSGGAGGLFDSLLFNPSGALGEYSIACLVLGGLYLVLRNRISWHIPFSLFLVFVLSVFAVKTVSPVSTPSFSLGGLMLGALFMATDMPSSASTPWGKCYYGGMIGLVAVLFIVLGLKYEYMSYSILLLNGFSRIISRVFRPRVWGERLDWATRLWQGSLLTVAVLAAMYLVAVLHQTGFIPYVLYAYILFCVGRYALDKQV